jgi:hypothetical protein
MLIEKMVKKSKAQAEQTPITTVRSMNDGNPMIAMSDNTQINDPQIS